MNYMLLCLRCSNGHNKIYKYINPDSFILHWSGFMLSKVTRLNFDFHFKTNESVYRLDYGWS